MSSKFRPNFNSSRASKHIKTDFSVGILASAQWPVAAPEPGAASIPAAAVAGMPWSLSHARHDQNTPKIGDAKRTQIPQMLRSCPEQMDGLPMHMISRAAIEEVVHCPFWVVEGCCQCLTRLLSLWFHRKYMVSNQKLSQEKEPFERPSDLVP